ncbi:MAG: collagen-like protein, partial [Flavobacteriaceae bacterium]|nr:collagen-like protein [Flavobacteriaceae bacterium]
MKKQCLLLIAISAMIFIGCDGDTGPQGPQGPPGTNILGQVFETEIDFNAPDYEALVSFPQSIEVFESDVVVAFILWEVVPDNAGGTLDVWRPLPQVAFTQNGIFSYNYDFTFFDVRLFLEAEAAFDFNSLTAADTQNQIFRIA